MARYLANISFVIYKIKYELPVVRPPWLTPTYQELQTVVNEPIYDAISYFILILTWSTTN